jgi:DNA-binding MarR family transcriptional regulator
MFGPLRMTDLARLERVSKSSVTRIVGHLSADGLVSVTPDTHDGRSMLVGMTPQGKEVLAATSMRTDTFFLTRLADFSDAEKVMLEAAVMLLERMVPSADDKPVRPAEAQRADGRDPRGAGH